MPEKAAKTTAVIDSKGKIQNAVPEKNGAQIDPGMLGRLAQQARVQPERLTPRSVIALQRSIGNRAVTHVLAQRSTRVPAIALHPASSVTVQRVSAFPEPARPITDAQLMTIWKDLKEHGSATMYTGGRTRPVPKEEEAITAEQKAARQDIIEANLPTKNFVDFISYVGDQLEPAQIPAHLRHFINETGDQKGIFKDPHSNATQTRTDLLNMMLDGFTSIFERKVEKPIQQFKNDATGRPLIAGLPSGKRYVIGFRSDDRPPEALGTTDEENVAIEAAKQAKAAAPNTGLRRDASIGGVAPAGFTPKVMANLAFRTRAGLNEDWNPLNPAFEAQLAASFSRGGKDEPVSSQNKVPDEARSEASKLMLFRNKIADNDLNTLISVAKNWNSCIRFPLYSDKSWMAVDDFTHPPYNKRLDTHLYVLIVDSSAADTEALQSVASKFPEFGVRSVPGQHILAHFSVKKFYNTRLPPSEVNLTYAFEIDAGEVLPWGAKTMADATLDPQGKIRQAYAPVRDQIANSKGGISLAEGKDEAEYELAPGQKFQSIEAYLFTKFLRDALRNLDTINKAGGSLSANTTTLTDVQARVVTARAANTDEFQRAIAQLQSAIDLIAPAVAARNALPGIKSVIDSARPRAIAEMEAALTAARDKLVIERAASASAIAAASTAAAELSARNQALMSAEVAKEKPLADKVRAVNARIQEADEKHDEAAKERLIEERAPDDLALKNLRAANSRRRMENMQSEAAANSAASRLKAPLMRLEGNVNTLTTALANAQRDLDAVNAKIAIPKSAVELEAERVLMEAEHALEQARKDLEAKKKAEETRAREAEEERQRLAAGGLVLTPVAAGMDPLSAPPAAPAEEVARPEIGRGPGSTAAGSGTPAQLGTGRGPGSTAAGSGTPAQLGTGRGPGSTAAGSGTPAQLGTGRGPGSTAMESGQPGIAPVQEPNGIQVFWNMVLKKLGLA